SASISRTIWPLPTPPMAGLQLIWAITPMFMVMSSTELPMLAAAAAASQPAWPPPTTMMSYSSIGLMFHVERMFLLADNQVFAFRLPRLVARKAHVAGHRRRRAGCCCPAPPWNAAHVAGPKVIGPVPVGDFGGRRHGRRPQ